jgi:hypothetical protein
MGEESYFFHLFWFTICPQITLVQKNFIFLSPVTFTSNPLDPSTAPHVDLHSCIALLLRWFEIPVDKQIVHHWFQSSMIKIKFAILSSMFVLSF